MRSRTLIAAGLAAAMLHGCASSPDEMTATYVSPLKYKDYDCDQLVTEMDYVSNRTATLYSQLKKKADNDTAQMAVGALLFWPALFFLEGGDGPEATEYANLKGEFEALRVAANQRRCSAEAFPKSPEQIIREQEEAARKQQAEG